MRDFALEKVLAFKIIGSFFDENRSADLFRREELEFPTPEKTALRLSH